MTEKEIMYFISSHSIDVNNKMKFRFPVLPDPKMGKKFTEKIKKEFKEIENWIKENPEKFKLAERGYCCER